MPTQSENTSAAAYHRAFARIVAIRAYLSSLPPGHPNQGAAEVALKRAERAIATAERRRGPAAA